MSRLFALDHEPTSDDWYTPAWVFEGMGFQFDLDVCSPPGGLDWVTADRYYTESDDGLLQSWKGWVWCNPPYSGPRPWCERWARHDPGGALLLRADLSAIGPFTAFSAATSVWVPKGRLSFIESIPGTASSVNFSTVLLGKGAAMDVALARLADTQGGTTRLLREIRA